jgi:hypothetical protein
MLWLEIRMVLLFTKVNTHSIVRCIFISSQL